MILVIGGSHQGKLHWALEHFGYTPEQVVDGEKLPLSSGQPLDVGGAKVLWHLETLLRRTMEQGCQLNNLPEDLVVICDSVGGGLVPIDRVDRQWRELVGRTCCELAAQATEVWRIFCGLPQRLK